MRNCSTNERVVVRRHESKNAAGSIFSILGTRRGTDSAGHSSPGALPDRFPPPAPHIFFKRVPAGLAAGDFVLGAREAGYSEGIWAMWTISSALAESSGTVHLPWLRLPPTPTPASPTARRRADRRQRIGPCPTARRSRRPGARPAGAPARAGGHMAGRPHAARPECRQGACRGPAPAPNPPGPAARGVTRLPGRPPPACRPSVPPRT